MLTPWPGHKAPAKARFKEVTSEPYRSTPTLADLAGFKAVETLRWMGEIPSAPPGMVETS